MYGWAGSNVIKDECESLHKSSSDSWAYISDTRAVLYTCKYITIMVSCSMFGKKWKYQKHEFDFIIYLRVIRKHFKTIDNTQQTLYEIIMGLWSVLMLIQTNSRRVAILVNNNCEFSVWKLDGGSRHRITIFLSGCIFNRAHFVSNE